ncbi:FadD3 family acyl-CoA ligase [Streptacidiphilus neutrinimicus]|uniref:FadD3 family acyl-CoA ligase n=1 Tax=Streptacidiphilus neutrinimicus TaxID=105420 RepID=UPI0005A83E6D|nr:FadD3 family acyl-CoA ligase [Streptacidiphilus neutrinimicus]
MRADLEWGTIANLVQAAGARYGGREAVVGPRTRFDYTELARRVRRAAAGLMAAGVRPGDRIGIWAPNTPDYVVAALGAVSAGAVLVPLGTRLKGGEAAALLRRTRASLLFVTSTFLGVSYVSALRAAGPLPDLRATVVLGETEAVPDGLLSWRAFLAAGADIPERSVRARIAAVAPGDPADIMFTSGTTGVPKGAITTHAQTLRAFGAWAELAGLAEDDRYLVVNPFTHTFGWKAGVLACLMRGATILPQPVFDPEAVLAKIATEGVTVLPGAPTVYQALLDHPARDQYALGSLRLAVTGAAVVPLELVHRIRDELGFSTVLTAYGLTESCGMVTMCRRDDTLGTVAATSGRAIPDVEVRVRDADGKDVSPGHAGEVQVRGYTVMCGYFEDEAATAETFTDDGWLRTGDVGVLDADGNLRITDRLKDMYTVGGFNAYPAEIERILARHPLVADSAVVGVPDPRLGEVGRAFVIPRQQPSPDAASELVDWCRREMANYKVPREVVFVDELPRNASGKVLKGELRRLRG